MTDVARVHLYDFHPQSHLDFTVIFPQFLDVHQPLAMQFVIMGTKFIVLEWVTIAIDVYIGLYLRKVLQTARGQRNFNRAGGGLLGAVGLALLTSRS
jgi:homoserine/homoserine lactone efflux protein